MTGIETLVASAVASQVARKISDFASEEIKLCCNFHGDLEYMKKTLSDMQPQLKRAEDNSFGTDRESVREWLRLMKAAAYDIEDILDEYYYHSPGEQSDEICCCIACAGKVPLLCSLSMSNPVLTRICMIHKMKTEKQRLQKELVPPSAYGLCEVINSPGNSFEEKETTSQANGTAIIGRDKDVDNVMAMVRVKDYQIITILGAVGLGKTSLAQLVYSHNETSNIFGTQKMWIHVPKGKASLKYIGTYMISRDGGKIHENMTEEDIINGVGAMLNKYDSYLIVLDGLWSANEKALQFLKEMLTTGSERNVKVIVTTHSEKVAELMSTTKLPYKLDILSEANILTIFSQRAMSSNDEMKIITQHPLFSNMLKKYGKKIIERCEGTPLVANFLGSVVSSGRLSRQWGDYWAPVSIEEMWKVEEDFDNSRCNISLLLPSLKPIYYNMHNELRLCFVYLSIFPKGSSINKKKLIQQWIALNMIEPSKHGNLRREETAEDYIDQLKAMYFLQITAEHSPVNEEVLHVHNLAYELARSVGSKDILVISDATTKKEAKKSSCNHDYRYAQLSTPVLLSVDPKDCIHKARSLILKTLESERVFLTQVISENKYLRVLDLRGCSICKLPGCIFKLKHLRYLDVSGLPIKVLPPELGNLVKLETLDVSGTNLTLVPSCISSLKVLNYLNLKGCQNLQQLHSLDQLHELCYLNLSGCLSIRNLPESLRNHKNLCFLNLSEIHILPDGLLQSLENLESLEDLILSGLEVKSLPDIFSQFSSLQFLNLSKCSKLQQLPKSFAELRSLKGLDLSFCSGIEEITESFGRLYSLTSLNLSGCSSLKILPTSLQDLAHLEELNLSSCTALAELPVSFCSLSSLTSLNLCGCSSLKILPTSLQDLAHLEELNLSSCTALAELPVSFCSLYSLTSLNLCGCSSLRILPTSFGDLIHLKELNLSSCAALAELPVSFGCLCSLTSLNLSGCSSLRILPTSFGDLIHLEELNLSSCTTLAELPISFHSLERLHVLRLSRCIHLIEQVNHLTNSLEHLELTFCEDINLQSNFFSYLTRLRVLDLSNCSQIEIVIGTPSNLEVLILANVALPLDLNFLTQFQNLEKLDITDAMLSTDSTALSNLQNIFTCMPMLETVETNNSDIRSILPSRIKITRAMDSPTGVESSNVRDRETTDGRSSPSVVEEGRLNTSDEGSDHGHSSSCGEEITEDTYVEAANRDLASRTNSDPTKVDALEDYAQQNINGEQILQDCEHEARSINRYASSSTSSGPILSASSSGTSPLDST